ncbi:MAG TPA: FAD-dependent oxidoreductase, partial [Ktedonobacterales bacterium]|nr:FAD-dependent oxidoreductase [Ktedonobacterales bacterium]
ERRAAVLECLGRYFGARATTPTEYVEQSWAEEEYTRGCYAGYMPPGVWSMYGPALRTPIGRIHWAGTETATVWNGYMEGAVQSGERAAAEILAALGK